MSSSNDKLGFIFLCDGPCTASSWRNEDKSMYWARRDALARISAMSLWQGPGNDSCISDDCSLLFHEAVVNVGTNEKEDLLAAIAMTGPQLVSALPIPTESSLICRWKAAATMALKYPQQAEIGNVQVKALRLQKESDSEMPCGIQMSFTPWRETAFLSHAFTAPRPSKADSSPVTSNQKVPATNNSKLFPTDSSVPKSSGNAKIGKTGKDVTDSCETFDKRFILRTMQKQCSVEFLRKHFLNGSEDLVLKKRNKASILSAYDEWRNMKNVTNSKESELDDECTAQGGVDRSCNDASSNISGSSSGSSSSSSSSSGSRLVDTFTVLYNRSRSSSAQCSRTTVLLLHEDYPEELPIFTTINSKKALKKKHDTLKKKEGVFSNCDVIMEINNDNDSHRVICVLGAVRDASDVEVEAAIRAAERMGIRCVGANLGRTAEFTSKIVATLVGHALAGQLGQAVDSLSDVRTSMTMTMTHQNNTTNQKTNTILNPTSHSMNAMAKIKKLEPQRMGGWSWDGSSNKIAKKDEKLQHLSTTDKVAARINDVVSTDNTVIQSVKDCILFHVILWLPYCASNIRIEIEHRERFHILIQCAVCTLWRSRIASEDSHKKKVTAIKNDDSNPLNRTAGTNKIHNDDSSNNDGLSQSKKRKFQNDEKTEMAPKNLVQPTLSLVFLDGSTASITQEQLTLSMARKRMAAPTEYQVLSSIIELLNDPILQLIQKIPNILPKNHPDTVNVNGLSSNINNSEKNEELFGLEGRKGFHVNKDLEDGLWIQSLQSLLPKSLNRKQRKKIHIIDINDLLSSTTIGDSKSVKRNNDVNYNGLSRNEKFNQGENLLPSLSSIVYGFRDTSALPGFSQDDTQSKKNKDEVENEDEEIPSQVLVLLRPAVHYLSKSIDKQNQNLTAKSPFSSSKTTVFNSKIGKSIDQCSSSIPSDNMDFYTKVDQKRYSKIENTELNKMLNEYMYGKNSKKYDITAKSVLYCTASLFASIPDIIQQSVLSTFENPLPETIKGHSKSIHHTHIISSYHADTNKRDTLENTKSKSKSKHVSPGIAVCVLQHWAYHKKLLPTLQTAQKNYLRIVS